MWVAFALQKLLTFFQQKISVYLRITDVNFNESLTNDIVSFEQLGPGWKQKQKVPYMELWWTDVTLLEAIGAKYWKPSFI